MSISLRFDAINRFFVNGNESISYAHLALNNMLEGT